MDFVVAVGDALPGDFGRAAVLVSPVGKRVEQGYARDDEVHAQPDADDGSASAA